MTVNTLVKKVISLWEKRKSSKEEQFPWSKEFAAMIKKEREATPFRVRYQEFKEQEKSYFSLFTPIIRQRWK